MEMNFPHKGSEWPALDDRRDVGAQRADHQTLLAKAIARQTSSQTARKFVAAKRNQGNSSSSRPVSFLDDRMAFFAGRTHSSRTDYREITLFRTGSFRPDLAQ